MWDVASYSPIHLVVLPTSLWAGFIIPTISYHTSLSHHQAKLSIQNPATGAVTADPYKVTHIKSRDAIGVERGALGEQVMALLLSDPEILGYDSTVALADHWWQSRVPVDPAVYVQRGVVTTVPQGAGVLHARTDGISGCAEYAIGGDVFYMDVDTEAVPVRVSRHVFTEQGNFVGYVVKSGSRYRLTTDTHLRGNVAKARRKLPMRKKKKRKLRKGQVAIDVAESRNANMVQQPDVPRPEETVHCQTELRNFHEEDADMQMSHCTVCGERWWKRAKKTKALGDPLAYICAQCDGWRNKKHAAGEEYPADKFGDSNFMKPMALPEELRGLTRIEEMLIARVQPLCSVYNLKTGQMAGRNHVCSFSQDIGELCAELPRKAADLPLVVRATLCKGKDLEYRDLSVRRGKVEKALKWLIQNCPYYKDLTINERALADLPENGRGLAAMGVPVTIVAPSKSDNGDDADLTEAQGPPDNGASGAISPDEVLYTSMPKKPAEQDEAMQIKRVVQSKTDPLDWPEKSDQPVSEWQTPGLFTMAFPCLFGNGAGDPTNYGHEKSVMRLSLSEAFAHLIKFAERENGRWKYRFASCPRFVHMACGILRPAQPPPRDKAKCPQNRVPTPPSPNRHTT